MKKVKSLAAILMAIAILFVMAIPAFAETTSEPTSEPTTPNGSIEITSPVEGQTYNIYKMFDLEIKNGDKFFYTVTDAWKPFVETGDGSNYFMIDEQNYIILKDGAADKAAEIAKAALAFAKDTANGISSVATLPNGDSYKATGLDLGYYLVDSSLGALCGLTTTKPEATVNEKNGTPTVDKKVKDGDTYASENTASVGDTVEFKTTITVQAGAEKYVLHDNMDPALKLLNDGENKITVTVDGTEVAAGDTTYTLDTSPADSHTFDITFDDTYLSDKAGKTIEVKYFATLTKAALEGTNGKTNETFLKYGDDNTVTSKTTTYTYNFELVKVNSKNEVLSGAEFELYDAATGGNKIDVVDEGNGVYHIADAEEKAAAGFTSAKIVAGDVTIKGLGNGKYYLQETKAPEDYNLLETRTEVTINGANLDATVTAGTDGNPDTYVEGGVKVINYTGTELPSTGSIGTTIFYIVGGILLVGAGVLLVVRKRVSSEKNSK